MSDIWKLLKLFQPYWRLTLAGIALASGVILANVALLAVAGWFITAMALAGLGAGTLNYFTPAAAIRGLAIIRTVGRYGERLVTHDATLRLLAQLRSWFYTHLEPLAPAGLQFYRGGDLLSRLRADIDTLDNFYLRVLVPCVAALISGVAMTAFIAIYSVGIALTVCGGLLLTGVVIPWLAQRLGRVPGAQSVDLRSRLRSSVADSVRGLGELRVYQSSTRQAERIRTLSDRLIVTQRKRAWVDGLTSALSGLVTRLSLWAAVVIAVPLVANDILTGPDLALIALFLLGCFEAVGPLPAAFEALGETRAAARRILSVVESAPAVVDPEQESPAPARYDLALSAVRMRYEAGADWALDGLDLELSVGDRVAIVGPTGSGKSSIFNLLLRFWDYQDGACRIGGQPLNTFRAETVRGWCAVVSQQTHLFNTTIADNLRLAAPDADDQALWQALRGAQVADEIVALNNGLNTVVGETGTWLSGGQARRVAIARAFLKDAPILLLDEPTEGLDANAEQAVLEGLDVLMTNRTTLLITHRPQALGYVDRIAVMADGRVMEQGDPAALRQTGRYLPLYSTLE